MEYWKAVFETQPHLLLKCKGKLFNSLQIFIKARSSVNLGEAGRVNFAHFWET
jgi:hypothetical protein